MSSIDDFLQELENKHRVVSPSSENTDSVDQALADLQQPRSPQSPAVKNMSDLDQALADLQQLRSPSSAPTENTSDLDQALADLQQKPPQTPAFAPSPKDDRLSGLLHTLEQDATENKLKQTVKNEEIRHSIETLIESHPKQVAIPEQNFQAIAAVEKKKQQQEKYWHDKADAWLKELDPVSNEGLWFMEFAESYKSTHEAAIDYLKALE